MADSFAVHPGRLPFSGSVLTETTADVDDATIVSDDIGNLGGAGVIVTVVTANGANSPSVTFSVEGKDQATGEYYELLASAAVTTDTTTVLMVHPALTAASNESASALLPDIWRVKAVGGAATGATVDINVGACLTP